MFMGEYDHSIDPKGRLIIPLKFRELLGDEIVITRGFEDCLFVYSKEEWANVEETFRKAPQYSAETRYFLRHFIAGACEVEIDKQGRALIPQKLREFAGLDKDVVLAGMLTRVEIWSRERWTEINAAGDINDATRKMADLGLIL
jgi:MraZ protein